MSLLDDSSTDTQANIPDGYKVCFTCKKPFPATVKHFNKDSSKRDGLNSNCRKCRSKKRKAQYHEDIEKSRAQGRQNRLKYRDVINTNLRRRRRENPEPHREESRRWRQENPERYKQQMHNYYIAHTETLRQRTRDWVKAHPERARTAKRVGGQKRIARKKQMPDAFSTQDWQHTLDCFDHRCAYCGAGAGLFRDMKLTMDHYIPVAAENCPGTVPTNIVPACLACNVSKSNNPAPEWLIWQYGKRKARAVIRRIENYFNSLK